MMIRVDQKMKDSHRFGMERKNLKYLLEIIIFHINDKTSASEINGYIIE